MYFNFIALQYAMRSATFNVKLFGGKKLFFYNFQLFNLFYKNKIKIKFETNLCERSYKDIDKIVK